MESQIWCSHSVRKETMAAAWLLEFYLGGSCPLALALMPDTAFSPSMLLVPFQLLPKSWSPEEVSLCKSKDHCGPFKRRCLRILVSSAVPTPTDSARSYGDLSSWPWNPGLGGVVWGWDPLLLRYSSRFSSTTHGCGTALPISPPLCPSYQSG